MRLSIETVKPQTPMGNTEMTPISDIGKLEYEIELSESPAVDENTRKEANKRVRTLLRNLAPSLIADWKQMHEQLERWRKGYNTITRSHYETEIERLTKERDEAYERAAQVCDGLSDLHANGEVWISACEMCADDIRALKAKEE